MGDRLTIARRVAASLGQVGADKAAGLLGRSIPLSPGELTEQAVFGRLGLEPPDGAVAMDSTPVSITPTGIESPSSNCQNTIAELEWRPDAQGSTPDSVFIKQSAKHFPTRLFANIAGFWDTECAFAKNLSTRMPIETPHIFGVARDRSRFVIVMENLHTRPDTMLFINKDLLGGVDLDRAQQCLGALAELHAGMSGLEPAEREQTLPVDLHPYLSPTRAPIMAAINRQAIERCHKRAPETFTRDHTQLYRRAIDNRERLARTWYRDPMTLVHGDSHIGNFFESSGKMGLLDFQAAHWGSGLRDVAYFLVNSMRADQLAAHEDELVEFYCEQRRAQGAPLAAAEGFEDYRGLSFQVLMTAVVSLGLGSFTDSEAVMRAMLERAVAAVDRLDFTGWLDEMLAESAA